MDQMTATNNMQEQQQAIAEAIADIVLAYARNTLLDAAFSAMKSNHEHLSNALLERSRSLQFQLTEKRS